MNPAEWCVKNNRTALIIFLLVIVGGFTNFFTMSRMEDPKFTVRTAVVVTPFPGAAPDRVESLVTDKLEKKIREMPEVKRIESQSMTGVSILTIDIFDHYKNVTEVWDKLRNKVRDARSSLPKEVRESVVNDEFGDVFSIVLALTGDGYSYRQMKDVAMDIRNEFLNLEPVGKVNLYGLQEERIYVEFSNARIAEYGYTPFLLAQRLASQNVITPSGEARVGNERIVLDTSGEFKLVDQLQNASLRRPGAAEGVRLSDAVNVHRGFIDPPLPMMRFNGEPAIFIAINMDPGFNISELGDVVQKHVADLQSVLPVGLEINTLVYQPKFVHRGIVNFTMSLLEAIAFVLAVMFLFTGIRNGLIVGTLVPTAMLACILVMPYFDISLQRISIAALIIALGILVDNGVVVSEAIFVGISKGRERLDVIKTVTRELRIPLLVSSLTTIFAFLPILLAQSGVGEYTLSLFIVVTSTLLASWVLSMTLVPFLCYYFLKPQKSTAHFIDRLYPLYREVLRLSLTYRARLLILIVGLFFVSVAGFKLVPRMFFPPNDREMFVINLWLPYGSDIRYTSEQAQKIESFLLQQDEVESVGTLVGEGGPRWYLSLRPKQAYPNYSFFVINTHTVEGVEVVSEATKDYIARNLPDARYSVRRLENGPAVGNPIQVRISGEDIDTLYQLRDQVFEEIDSVAGISHLHDDWGEWTKKMSIDVDQNRARRAGLTSFDIALSLQTQVSGYEATQYREGEEVIPIVIRSQDDFRKDLGSVEDLKVFTVLERRNLPLSQVATTHLEWQPSNIRRRDAQRTITLKADLEGRYATQVMKEIEPKIDALTQKSDWPRGYSVSYGGEVEKSKESKKSIKDGLPIAAGLLIFVLIAQFNSIRAVAIIMLTVPLMMIGVTPGLLLTQSPFGFMAMLGFISLAGIVVNNALMMIDRIEWERKRGVVPQDAIVNAAITRLRPILATALTTIMGLIPLALQGGEFWRPMANTIIFGLAFATVLTLGVCPVLYSLFYKIPFKDYDWKKRS